jgi:predicted ATPase
MLTKITLENFKVFRHATEFPLAKINLLTGINGRGKSSLLQSILLFKQSVEQNENTSRFFLNGAVLSLGTMRDLKNRATERTQPIKIAFSFRDLAIPDNIVDVKYTLQTNPNEGDENANAAEINACEIRSSIGFYNRQGQREDKIPFDSKYIRITRKDDSTHEEIWEKGDGKEVIFASNGSVVQRFLYLPMFLQSENYPHLRSHLKFKNIHYIAADRIGAKDYYPKNFNLANFITIDKKGENVIDILAYYENKQVHDNVYRESNEASGFQNLGQDVKTQVGEWIGWILDAIVKVIPIKVGDYVNQLEFEINGKKFKPSNVGFGYSYILPIITAGLIANAGEILIVENPEAHLHPKAQSRLTGFLAKVAATGVQVFVESHSEHILNGLRIATLKKEIDLTNEDVSVLYFQDVEKQPFIRLNIEKDGSIKNWVEGFFDQQEIDLSEIFKLNRAKK